MYVCVYDVDTHMDDIHRGIVIDADFIQCIRVCYICIHNTYTCIESSLYHHRGGSILWGLGLYPMDNGKMCVSPLLPWNRYPESWAQRPFPRQGSQQGQSSPGCRVPELLRVATHIHMACINSNLQRRCWVSLNTINAFGKHSWRLDSWHS